MAVKTTIQSNKVIVHLKNGTVSGSWVTVPCAINNLSKDNFDGDKILNITALLEYCLAKEIYSVEHIQTAILSEE